MPPPANGTDKHLFPAGMQKGREYVEVFSSSGSDPTSWWHVNQSHKQKISRHYNHELRSYYVSIGANCALPKAPQTLHLLQSKLIFQIMVPGVSQGFRANIICQTLEGNTRSIFVNSLLKAPLLNNLQRKCLPLNVPSNAWTNVVVDLQDLITHYFKERFASLDRIELLPCMRVRRIFTQRSILPTSSPAGSRSEVEIRDEMMLHPECCAGTILLDSSSAGGDPRGDRVPRSLASSEDGGEEEEEEEEVGRAWRSDDDDGSGSEVPGVVGGGGLVLSAEERRRLDEALEDLDDGSSVDSDTWDLVPKSRARRRVGGGILHPGGGDAELYSSVTRLLAAKRRSDAKVNAVEADVERLKNVKEQAEVDEALEKMARAQKRATSAETALEDTWSELCAERSKVKEMDEELKNERGWCLSYRTQVRTLQALLRKVDEHSKTLSRELMLRDMAHGPLMKKNAEEKKALESKVDRLETELHGQKEGAAQLGEEGKRKEDEIARLEGEVEKAAERLQAMEDLRSAEAADHAASARKWARDTAEDASRIRSLEATIADLEIKDAEGRKARSDCEEAMRLLRLRDGELEEMRGRAGAVERKNQLLMVELEKAQEAVKRATLEREAEGERLHRDQVLQFARFETQYHQDVTRLRERTEKAEKMYRKEWIRGKDLRRGHSNVYDDAEEVVETPEGMSVDSLVF